MSSVVASKGRFGAKSRELKIAVGDTVKNPNVKNQTLYYEDFRAEIEVPIRTKESYKEYIGASKERQNTIKDKGYYVPGNFSGGKRKKQFLGSRWCFTGDIDFAPVDFIGPLSTALDGFAWLLHSSHKHSPDKPRLRIIVPFSREVSADEYEAVSRRIAAKINIDWFDATTFEWARVMHWPSVSSDGAYVFDERDGQWINPDDVLAEYDDWTDISQWPVAASAKKSLHKAAEKADDPTSKRGIVGAFCRAYDVEQAIETFLPAVYEKSDIAEGRYSYVEGTTANGVVVYDNGAFLFSHHGTDPVGGSLVNSWDLVRLHRFGHLDEKIKEGAAPTSLPSFKAMREIAQDDPRVKGERLVDLIDSKAFDEFHSELGDGLEDSTKSLDALVGDIKGLLELDSNDNIKATIGNAATLLRCDPNLIDSVGLNEFTHTVCQRRDLPNLPIRTKDQSDVWSDAGDIWVKYYLERTYRVTFSTTLISESIDLVAREKRYHPVREYLEKVEWDGKPRLDKQLHEYLGTPDDIYHAQVNSKWMLAGVARIFEPGIKFDQCLVLEGEQGIRKSAYLRVLAGDYFTDSVNDITSDKAVIEQTQGAWIVEIPELHAYNRAEIEAQKAFFSKQAEKARLAYERRVTVLLRQFIIAMTTNEDQYLKDSTGGRRYWSVRVNVPQIDTDRLAANRDQLWAEAVHRYRQGESLVLDGAALDQAKQTQESRLEHDPLIDMLDNWLLVKVPVTYHIDNELYSEFTEEGEGVYRDRVCAAQVWVELMGKNLGDFTIKDSKRIKRALSRIPYLSENSSSCRFGSKYGTQRGFTLNLRDDEFGL